jgi:hypothetical protein
MTNPKRYWFFLFAICLPGVAQSTVNLSELLAKTARAYSTDRYDIRVEYSSAGHSVGGDQMLGTAQLAIPKVAPNHFHIVRSGHAMRNEIESTASGKPLIILSDGTTEWSHEVGGKEYTERPAPAWPDLPGPTEPADGLSHFDWRFFSRFRAVESALPQAKLIGIDQACENTETAHVQIQIGGTGRNNKESVLEDLWISVPSGLVCRMNVKQNVVMRGQLQAWERVTTWKYEKVGAPIDATLFTFQPPSQKARKVRALRKSQPDRYSWN